MTTVYIDKRCGLAMTDSRVTSTMKRAFLGIFPVQDKSFYNVVLQKSMYIHDRLFLACGNVAEINKVLNYLCIGEQVIPSRKDSCQCVLLDKEYCIHLIIYKGKFYKKTQFIGNDFVLAMGSGSPYMKRAQDAIPGLLNVSLSDFVLDQFSKVHNKDVYTDDNINIYKI